MPNTHDKKPTQRRTPLWDDRALYPELINQGRDQREQSWWGRRLRLAVADYLADPAASEDYRHDATAGIRAYQRELAWRSRTVLIQRVHQGWWLGPAPFGYLLEHHRIRENTGRSGWRHRLVVDPRRASTVVMIFNWYVDDQLTETEILARLTADRHPHPHPQPVDHVTGKPRPWTTTVLRTILSHPAYLGYVVWGRTSHGQPQPKEHWHCSAKPSHPALVDPALFWAAYDRLQQARKPSDTRQPHQGNNDSPEDTNVGQCPHGDQAA